MLKILVIDGLIMFADIFRILISWNQLSIPVDFDVLRFRMTETNFSCTNFDKCEC
jgi:hypothetical protein